MAAPGRAALCLGLVTALTLSLSTCDLAKVGLGDKVDLNPPSVSVRSHKSGEYVRGTVALSGTATDDSGVKSVSVSVQVGSASPAVYAATIANGVWTQPIDTTTFAPDNQASSTAAQGEQADVLVTCTDQSGKTATTSITLYFDNTPPALWLQVPSLTELEATAGADRRILDKTVRFQGGAKDFAGSQVSMSLVATIGGVDLPPIPITGNIAWSVDVDTLPMTADINIPEDATFTFVATDPAGNKATLPASVHIDQNRDAPVFIVPALGIDLRTGTMPSGSLPPFAPGQALTITVEDDDAIDIGSVAVSLVGAGGPVAAPGTLQYNRTTRTTSAGLPLSADFVFTFSSNIADLPLGRYGFEIAASDDLTGKPNAADGVATRGISGASAPSIVVDQGAPSLDVTSPANGSSGKTLTVAGTASDGYDIQSVSVRLNNGAWTDIGAAGLGTPTAGTYHWTYSPTGLADGSYTVDVQALDQGGTYSLIKTVAVIIDNTAPTVGFANVSPLVGTNMVNGVISFTATASDLNGLSDVRWWVLAAPPLTPPAWTDAGSTSFSAPYVANIDTTTIAGGAHKIWVSARDQAGNERSASYDLDVNQSSDLPAVTLTNMDASRNTAAGAASNLQETNAKLTGSAADDDSLDASTIEISIDSASVYGAVTTRGPSGRTVGFEHNLGALAEGTHYFYLRASDLASAKSGKPAVSSVIGPVYFLIDRAPPDLSVTSPGSGSAHNTAFSITGTSADANGVVRVEISSDAGTTWSTLATAAGAWSYNASADPGHADDGAHPLLFRATDSVGKTTTVAFSYTIDTRAPTFSITAPTGGVWLSGATVTASGTATDSGVGVSLVQWSTTSSAGPWADASGATSWTALIDLAALGEGSHTLYVRAADLAGNQSLVAEIEAGKSGFGVDQNDPTSAETGIGTPVGFRSTLFALSGTATDTNALARVAVTEKKDSNPAVTVLDQALTGTSQAWSIPSLPSGGLVDGTYLYAITVTDVAGRTSASLTRTMTIDRTPPTASISAPTALEWAAGDAYTVRGASDDGAGVGVQEVRYFVGASAPADPSTWSLASGTSNWSATLDLDTDGGGPNTGLAEGQYLLSVSAKDAAGNWMGSAVTVTFGVDQASPSLTGLSIPSGANYQTASFSLDGTAADTNALAALSVTQSKDGGAPVTLPAIAVSGTSQAWSLSGLPRDPADPAVTALADGVYEYVLTVTDAAGKPAQVTRTVTVDTAPPTVGFVSVSPIVGTDTVNGVISFTVSASDANGLTAVKWWLLPAADPAPGWTTAGDNAFAAAPYTAATDTTSRTDLQGYKLWAGARDQAGNAGYASFALSVDQASDLPVITLTNMDAGATTADQFALNLQENNAKLTGTMTDDDSLDASTVQISIDSAASFGPVTTSGPSGRTVSFEHNLSGLPEGIHFFYLRASDLAGAKSGKSAVQTTVGPVYFVIDRAAPSLAFTSPAQNSVSRTDFAISGTASDLNGLKDRNTDTISEIEVSEDGGTTWVQRDVTAGSWTYSVTGLFGGGQEGTHTFTVRATDIFGKETVGTFAFMVDTVGPVPVVTDPGADNQLVTGTTVSMSGTASDGSGSGIASVEFSTDGSTWTSANGTSSWTANIDLTALSEGSNTLSVRATDPAGNQTVTPVQRIFLLDRTPPTASESGLVQSVVYRNASFGIVVNAADTLGLGTLTITESKNGAAAVAVVDATPLAGTSDTYTLTKTVAGTHTDDGTYVYEITVLDSAGRSAPTIMRTVTVDTIAPVVSLDAPSPSILDGILKVNGTVTISGTVDEDSLDSVDYQVGAGPFTAIVSNKASPHFTVDTTGLPDTATTVVTVRATDKAGNAGTQTVDLNVYQESDRPRIVPTNLVLAGPNVLGQNPAILFTVEDDDAVDASMIQYSLDNGVSWSNLSTPSTTDGTFIQAKTTLLSQPEGPGTLWLRAMDVNAGANWSIYGNSANKAWSDVQSIPFFVDYGPPTITLASPAATAVFNDDVFVSGTTQDSMGVPTANIVIKIGSLTYTSTSSPAISVIQGALGNDPVSFELTIPISALSDGDYNLQILSTDVSGTTRTLDRPIGVDKTAPTNTFISPESGTTVNGTITIQGQVSDNRAIQQVYLWEGPSADTPPADVATWTHVGNTLLWSYSLNTTLAASGSRKAVVVTEDAAGNRSSNYTLPFTVDQNADKPVIELTTLKAAGTYTENLLPTTLQIAGTISDDDGVDKAKIEVAVDLNKDGDLADPGEEWTVVSGPPASNGRVVTWSHTFSSLGNNQFELHVRAADIYDSAWGTYSSSTVGPVHFAVDTANPAGSVTSPDQGVYTNSTTMSIQGHASDGSGVQSVQLKFGSNTYLAATSNGYADWTYSHDTSVEGQVSFQVVITDVYGKVSTIDRYYILDTTPPSAAIDTPQTNPDTASGAYNSTVTFRGTAADGVRVEALYYRFSSTPPIDPDGSFTGWTLSSSTYNWTTDFDTRTANNTGVDSTHYLAVVAVDSSGNRSGLVSRTFTINQASDQPGLALSAPTDAQVLGTSAKALGTVSDDDGLASVEIRIDENNDGDFLDLGKEDYAAVSVPAVVSGRNLNFENSLASLADGAYRLQIRVRDSGYAAAPALEKAFHEKESAVLSFTIDTLPPSLALTRIEVEDRYGGASRVYTDNFGGRYINNDSIFTFSASDSSGITSVEFSTDGSTWNPTVYGAGVYTYDLTVDISILHSFDGTRNLQYRATDANGKVTTSLVTVIVDTVEPTVEFTSPSGVSSDIGVDAPNVNGDVIIQGTVTDGSAVTGVTIKAGIGDAISLSNTGNSLSWKVTLTDSGDYANATYATDKGLNIWRLPVKITATEFAGNKTETTGYVDIDPNSDNPVVSVVSPGPGDSVAGVFLINGTVSDDDGAQSVKLQIDLNNDLDYTDTVDLDGDSNTTDDFENEAVAKVITVTNGAWSILTNSSGELNKENLVLRGVAGATGTIGFKVTPVDIFGTEGGPQTQTVYIDSESPVIKGLLEDGLTEADEPTPPITDLQKGSITLRALFKDDKELLTSSMQVSLDGGATYQGINPAWITDVLTTNPYQYRIQIPVDTATAVSGGNGTLQIVLKVTDKTYKQTTKSVRYSVDNTLPEVAFNLPATLAYQGAIPDEVYSFKGSGSTLENEVFGKALDRGAVSGIKKVNVYFVRGSDFVNPRTGATQAVSTQTVRQSSLDRNGDGDYLDANEYVGSDQLIPFTEDSNLVISIDMRTELGQFDTNGSLGDNDGFNESLKAKTGYDEWYAYFNSTLFSDGPVDVYFVAYDQAGNKVYGVALGQMANHPPAVGSVDVGANTMNDSTNRCKISGTIDFTVNATDQEGVTVSDFKLTALKKYAVGGGGSIGAEQSFTAFWYGSQAVYGATGWKADFGTLNPGSGSATSAWGRVNIDTAGGDLPSGFWYLFQAQARDTHGNVATRDFYAWINNSDSSAPVVTMDDFGQTSVSGLSGHVEEYNHSPGGDNDADLSGIVRVTGTIYDDTNVSSVTLEVSYDGGTNYSDLPNPVTSFGSPISGNEIDGYTYNWSYTFDTSTITNGALSNLKILARGSDGPNTALSAAKTVDVVPYITDILTGLDGGLKNFVKRSALGKYTVARANAGTFTVLGYNITSSSTVTINGGATSGTASAGQFVVNNSASYTSGPVVVSTNGASSQNNTNTNSLSQNKEASSYNPLWVDDRYIAFWDIVIPTTDGGAPGAGNKIIGAGDPVMRPNAARNGFNWLYTQAGRELWLRQAVPNAQINAGYTFKITEGNSLKGGDFAYNNSTDKSLMFVFDHDNKWHITRNDYAYYGSMQWGALPGGGYDFDQGTAGTQTYAMKTSVDEAYNWHFYKGFPKLGLGNPSGDSTNVAMAYTSPYTNYSLGRWGKPRIVVIGTNATTRNYVAYYDTASATKDIAFYGFKTGTTGAGGVNGSGSYYRRTGATANAITLVNGLTWLADIDKNFNTNNDSDTFSGSGNMDSSSFGIAPPRGRQNVTGGATATDFDLAVFAKDGTHHYGFVAYFNADTNNLYLRYKTDLYTADPLAVGNAWSSPIGIDSNAGKYVKMVVDPAGALHLAYQDVNNGTLKYAYVTYTADTGVSPHTLSGFTVKKATVDALLNAGQYNSITVRDFGGLDYRPVITTYSSAFAGTTASLRCSYPVYAPSSGSFGDGVDAGSGFNQKWEIITVPAATTPQSAQTFTETDGSSFSAGGIYLGYSGTYLEEAKFQENSSRYVKRPDEP